jgi:hypothetical protein
MAPYMICFDAVLATHGTPSVFLIYTDILLLLLLLFWLYTTVLGLDRIFRFLILYTVRRPPWTGDQPVAKPLPTHRINAHNTNIHALSGIRTHDPSVRASEDSPRLRRFRHCGHSDRPLAKLKQNRVFERNRGETSR